MLWKASLKKLGTTPEEYSRMLLAQNGVCKICRKPETSLTAKGAVKMLAVDHNHVTKQVRGLLCHRCNAMLGYAIDNPLILRAGADYLERA